MAKRKKIVHEHFPMVNLDKMDVRKPEEDLVHLVLTFTNMWLDDILCVCSYVA